MARIRTIKPSFFTSLTVADIEDPWTRLCFIGLWTHSDDEGRCLADPRLIKAALFPLDETITFSSVTDMLHALADRHLITLYQHGERRYLEVAGWAEHQKISHPTKSTLPSPKEGTPVDSVNPPGELPESSGEEGNGMDGKGTFASIPKKPTTPQVADASAARARREIWAALAAKFGEPSTGPEKTNRGRQVKELLAVGATTQDIQDRLNEHAARRVHWTLTANALVTHWTDLTPRQSPVHVLNGAKMSPFVQG